MTNEIKIQELQRMIRGMNLPEHRKNSSTLENVRWLHKNLSIKNASDPKFAAAQSKIIEILDDNNMLSSKERKQLAVI